MMVSQAQQNLGEQWVATTGYVGLDRRAGADRRLRGTRPLSGFRSQGRRHRGRRKNDINTYVDRYDPALRIVCVGLLLLSTADAFLTLNLLERGGQELNPFMDFLLQIDVAIFFYTKLVLTALSLGFLVVHLHFRWLRNLRVVHILYGAFGAYLALIQYELFLLWQIGVG